MGLAVRASRQASSKLKSHHLRILQMYRHVIESVFERRTWNTLNFENRSIRKKVMPVFQFFRVMRNTPILAIDSLLCNSVQSCSKS